MSDELLINVTPMECRVALIQNGTVNELFVERTAKLAFGIAYRSEGGVVTLPLEKQMWGDVFGAVNDRYGISWMVNIAGTPG